MRLGWVQSSTTRYWRYQRPGRNRTSEFNTYDPERQSELVRRDIRRLLRALGDAIEAFARDDLAKETLGEAFHATLTDYKRREWNDYSLTVTDWERRRYLHQW